MKKKLLILLLVTSFCNINGQNKIWDFGGDVNYTSATQIAMWPVEAYNAAEGATVVKDGLTLVGDSSGDQFGQIENSGGKTWDAGTDDEYKAINRFKFNGGSAPVDFMPSYSYLSFPVTGPVDVKVWFRSGSSSANRTLYISDGTILLNSFDAVVDNTDPETITASYTGTGGTIYIYTSNSFNLYKIEVKESTLGLEFNDVIKTNVKAVDNQVYISEVDMDTEVNIYSVTGALVKKIQTGKDVDFTMKSGLWIVEVKTDKGIKSLKLVIE